MPTEDELTAQLQPFYDDDLAERQKQYEAGALPVSCTELLWAETFDIDHPAFAVGYVPEPAQPVVPVSMLGDEDAEEIDAGLLVHQLRPNWGGL